jgi:hypothetical protein
MSAQFEQVLQAASHRASAPSASISAQLALLASLDLISTPTQRAIMHCYDCPADSVAFSYTYNASKMYAESMHNKRMKRKQHSFLITAYTVYAHLKAPTRKATHNSVVLLLMRAAQHIKESLPGGELHVLPSTRS